MLSVLESRATLHILGAKCLPHSYRTFCASLTRAAAAVTRLPPASPQQASAVGHRVTLHPARAPIDGCLQESDLCFCCAADLSASCLPTCLASARPWSCCCLALPRVCHAMPLPMCSGHCCTSAVCFPQHFGRGCLSLWFLVGRCSFRAEPYAKLLGNRPLSPGFFLPSTFEPPLL